MSGLQQAAGSFQTVCSRAGSCSRCQWAQLPAESSLIHGQWQHIFEPTVTDVTVEWAAASCRLAPDRLQQGWELFQVPVGPATCRIKLDPWPVAAYI